MWYAPRGVDYLLIALLTPLALMYGGVMLLRRLAARKRRYDVPIISVGNLVVGGSGKTPAVIEIASRLDDVAVISRGYGRQSRGLVEVSRRGKILCDVRQSGDEAMLMAVSLPHASVIVSEDRPLAVRKAIADGARVIVLDDGFNRVDIDTFDILLEPSHLPNRLPFPAGPFREFAPIAALADVRLKEGRDFIRDVHIDSPASRMVLVTSIARPERLDAYLPKGVVHRYYLPDHAYFDKAELEALLKRYNAERLLVTQKDEVKLKPFGLPLSVMRLRLSFRTKIFDIIEQYLQNHKAGSYAAQNRSGQNAP